jgi:hypothetical protein
MKTVIIFILLTFEMLGQKPCNLDKYIFSDNVKVDSNSTLIYYTNDDKYFIAYNKSTKDSSIKYLFDKHILNFKGLLNIASNNVIVGAPLRETDSNGKVTYYSLPHDKFLEYSTNTYVIQKIKSIYTSKNDFILEIKLLSGEFSENFELKFHSIKPTKTYKTFADRINNSTLTCITYKSTDM